MKNLIFLFLLVLAAGMISCNADDSNCVPETIHLNWTKDKTILVEYNSEFQRNDYNIVNGENWLFEYNRSGAQCEDIFDDEWGEVLTFEIDKNSDDFEFVDENMLQTNCFYRQYGAWVRHNQYQIKDGMIKGEKKSANEWEIT